MAGTELSFDVVVVGAGLTGATLTLALATAGLKVAAVDAQAPETQLAPTFDGRASFIAYGPFRQWRALGLGETLEAAAQPVRSILVTDGPGPGASARAPGLGLLRFEAGELNDLNGDEPLGWMVENRHIRAALAERLAKADAALFAPVRVAGVETDGALTRVALADGRVLAAPLVVGAEGRRSAVREAAGIKTYGWNYPQAGVVATVALERPHEAVAHEYFLPGGPLAILPLTEDRASLVWTERTAAAKALVESSGEAFESHLARRFGDFLGRPRLIGPRFTYPLGLFMAEQLIAPRTALIGDAAHAVHPVAGQGLNMGLKDVAALAEVVTDALRLGEDWGSDVVLERYAAWRRFDAASLAAATDLFVRLFSNDDPVLRLARRVGMAAVNRIEPARKFFMREAGGAVGDVPRLLRGDAL